MLNWLVTVADCQDKGRCVLRFSTLSALKLRGLAFLDVIHKARVNRLTHWPVHVPRSLMFKGPPFLPYAVFIRFV